MTERLLAIVLLALACAAVLAAIALTWAATLHIAGACP